MPGPFALARPLRDADAVIVVDGAGAGSVPPVPAIVVAVFGRAFQLLLRDAGDVAAEIGIVFQRLPGQRVVVVADAQESTETQHRVGYLAAHLVDHHPFDGSDFLTVGAVNGGSLDLVATDQIADLSGFRRHISLPSV